MLCCRIIVEHHVDVAVMHAVSIRKHCRQGECHELSSSTVMSTEAHAALCAVHLGMCDSTSVRLKSAVSCSNTGLTIGLTWKDFERLHAWLGLMDRRKLCCLKAGLQVC